MGRMVLRQECPLKFPRLTEKENPQNALWGFLHGLSCGLQGALVEHLSDKMRGFCTNKALTFGGICQLVRKRGCLPITHKNKNLGHRKDISQHEI